MIRGYQVDPVRRIASRHAISPISYCLTNELNPALDTPELDFIFFPYPHFFLCNRIHLPDRLYP